MRADVVGKRRAAVERQAGSGVEADEIGSDRLAFAIDAAGAQRDPAGGADKGYGKQDPGIGARAPGVEPGAMAERRHYPADQGDHVRVSPAWWAADASACCICLGGSSSPLVGEVGRGVSPCVSG